jgi:hypothetical protein
MRVSSLREGLSRRAIRHERDWKHCPASSAHRDRRSPDEISCELARGGFSRRLLWPRLRLPRRDEGLKLANGRDRVVRSQFSKEEMFPFLVASH